MRKILVLVAVGMLCLSASAWAVTNQDPIPQGEFAAILASHLNAPPPPGGWTAPEAVSFLSQRGITPETGNWEAGATLNERTMTHLLRVIGISIYSSQPDAVVTYAKAIAVFNRYDDFFRNYNLATKTSGGDNTTHVDTALAGTDAVAPAASSNIP
jgi:hypothetical protein